MNNTISVTGLGIICSIGNNADSVLDSLLKRKSGVGPMKYLQSKHSYLPVGEVQLSNDQMKDILGIKDESPMSRTTLMGAIAIRQALEHAGITVEELNGKRVALISGTTVGGMDLTENYYEQMKTDDSLLYLPKSNECGKSTEEMAEIIGLKNVQTCTISTACSSALNSIILGSEMLKRDEVDLVIAGGSEALSRFHLNGFNTLMILDKEQCRPFDDTRAGLNLGEGAAFVILEKNTSHSLAYIAGYGNRCDAFHQTASSENGEGAYLAMKDALEMAGLQPWDIQYVNAHGTGTPNNDITESQSLKRIFGESMPEVSSTKAFTGHTTSASGSIEAVICILAMQNNFTPANLGWQNKIEGGIVPTSGKENVVLENVICNSFGFGGNDSSMVIRVNIADQSIMLLADTCYDSGPILNKTLGDHLKSDIVQIAHHGCYPSVKEIYNSIQAETILFPAMYRNVKHYVVNETWAEVMETALSYAKDIYVSGDAMEIIELPYTVQNNKEEMLEYIKNYE